MSDSPPDISIVVCSCNLGDALTRTLVAIEWARRAYPGRTECLIVHNGPAAESEATRISGGELKHVLEPKLGLARARNAGLAEAWGAAILFTDDDVVVPEDWVVRMVEPLLSGRADAIAGGVHLAIEPPDVLDGWGGLGPWAATTEGIDSTSPDRMVGASMGFRREVLEKVPGFDTELGAGAMGFGEETLFSYQLREAGFRLVADLNCVVDHYPDPERFTRERMLDHARRLGRSDAYVAYHWKHADLRIRRRDRLRQELGLWRRRLTSPSFWRGRLGIARWELYRVYAASFGAYFRSLSGTPRKYERRGLVKLESRETA